VKEYVIDWVDGDGREVTETFLFIDDARRRADELGVYFRAVEVQG
jgi:hypothetical protein